GSVLALHAGNWLEDDLRAAGGLAGEVPIHPQPVHLAAFLDLDLAHDGHVVLALARRHARVAADAGVQVDRHPPLVALLVGMLLPEREVMRFLLEDTVGAVVRLRRAWGFRRMRILRGRRMGG